MIDPRLRSDICKSEDCKLVAYLDTNKVWTIGWGHALQDGKDHTGLIWTQARADAQLDTDIATAQTFAAKTPEWSALDTACRQNAVIELCFNMQKKWLLFVNTRAAIRAHNWQSAHDGLLNSAWETEVHATRANRLANYLLAGQYPNAVQQG